MFEIKSSERVFSRALSRSELINKSHQVAREQGILSITGASFASWIEVHLQVYVPLEQRAEGNSVDLYATNEWIPVKHDAVLSVEASAYRLELKEIIAVTQLGNAAPEILFRSRFKLSILSGVEQPDLFQSKQLQKQQLHDLWLLCEGLRERSVALLPVVVIDNQFFELSCFDYDLNIWRESFTDEYSGLYSHVS